MDNLWTAVLQLAVNNNSSNNNGALCRCITIYIEGPLVVASSSMLFALESLGGVQCVLTDAE